MPLPLLLAGASAVSGIFSGISGLFGKSKAKKQRKKFMAKLEDRAGTAPEGVEQATNQAESLAQNYAMPGEDVMRDTIYDSASEGYGQVREGATSSAQVLMGATEINKNQTNALRELEIETNKSYMQRQSLLMNQLNLMGQYQDASTRDYLQAGMGQAAAQDNNATNNLNNMWSSFSNAGQILMTDKMYPNANRDNPYVEDTTKITPVKGWSQGQQDLEDWDQRGGMSSPSIT